MTWGHTLSLQKNKLQYEKLNRPALLMITPTRKTISTASLEVMYDLIPLDLIIQKTGLASHRRLHKITVLNWPGKGRNNNKKSHLKYWEDLKLEYELHYPETDKIKNFNWGRKYQIITESFGSTYADFLTHSQYTICLLYTSPSPRD